MGFINFKDWEMRNMGSFLYVWDAAYVLAAILKLIQALSLKSSANNAFVEDQFSQ